ncbi:MAG: hypothetical protein K2X99_01980, partial [Gemmatimonadaceae bacterium]|nr:hypothetical protein [Gemmatimonadaceae bacterium]
TDGARRTALVNASGLWRWKLRSARSGELYDAFWGSVLDWLTPRARAAGVEVDASSVREGEPIAWHTPDDSVRTVVLRAASGGRADSVALRGDDRGRATTPALAAGVYDASWRGGSTRIAVNPAAEWVPQRPTITSGAVGEVAVTPAQPTAREAWWVALIAVLALGAEWIIRRRGGLR